MINEHRKLAKQLQLFDISDCASGMVDWYPKGFELYRNIQALIRSKQDEYGYKEVSSPILGTSNLWVKSGHSAKYDVNMFHLKEDELSVKPMSCPFHISMFDALVQSYRQLPFRLAEFGLCHRNEPSGALNGLFRLRAFRQDDGHIFCRENQIKSELSLFCTMLFETYLFFGFRREQISVKISLRPDDRLGSDALWDRSEQYLQEGLRELGIPHELVPGEGAFYGAKVEFSLQDSMGRDWQCGTFQLDFFSAEKFNCSFVNELGEREYPVVLHRAVLGSLERFIAVLIEHYSGRLPVRFNPNSIIFIPVGQQHISFCVGLQATLAKAGIASVIDDSQNSIGYRVREAFSQKCNFSIVVGDDELVSNRLNLRFKKETHAILKEELVAFLLNANADV